MAKNNHNIKERDTEIYKIWEEQGAFNAKNSSDAPPFSIMIPPPNITGSLHVGHALTMTLQDILIRFKRLQGANTLWMPGTDHAGIATQMIVEQQLAKEGVSRKGLGREEFIQKVWDWKNLSGGNITKQLRRLGASLDWKRERFTLDPDFNIAVNEAFIELFKQGLIYRDKRLVNWDPKLQSAISDLEVKNQDTNGHLWYIRYPIENDHSQYITIATTRPETMLGDSAIAVNPKDERYINFIGKNVIIPLTGRIIPIIADDYCNLEMGSGAVKITPAHDFNDFTLGQRHNLSMPTIFDKSANIYLNEILPELKNIAGISNLEFIYSLKDKNFLTAREDIVNELKNLGFLDKIEPHLCQIPYAERGGAIVQPFLTTQWFCNASALAKPAIKAVENGEIKFVPKQWENSFFSWMTNIEPWCISRQLWWGHRIPAWYGPDGKIFVNYTEELALKDAESFYQTKEVKLTQDPDVLDTWFSSALWPFVTLGWPKNTADLNYFYPTDVLVTGFDIIFFWVARMMMMGIYFTKKIPFSTVFIHGLILDEHGQKMSKTKGNVIDPLEIIDNYGADCLRWAVCALSGPGRNLKLSTKQIETSRSFITKVNNATVFCERNNILPNAKFVPTNINNILCKWLLQETDNAINSANKALATFRFDEYSTILYDFIWHSFCDWFIELSKPLLLTHEADEVRNTGGYVLQVILKLLHPILPFTTEDLWERLGCGSLGSLINDSWPQVINLKDNDEAVNEIEWVKKLITTIRTIRAEMNIPYQTPIQILLKDINIQNLGYAKNWTKSISLLTKCSQINELKDDIPQGAAQIVMGEATVILPLNNIIDLKAELTRLEKSLISATNKLENIKSQLENTEFTTKAPANIVEEKIKQMDILKNDITLTQLAISRIKS